MVGAQSATEKKGEGCLSPACEGIAARWGEISAVFSCYKGTIRPDLGICRGRSGQALQDKRSVMS